MLKKMCILGDSILRGVQLTDGKYVVDNNLGLEGICEKAGFEIENVSKFGCTVTKGFTFAQRLFSRPGDLGKMVLMDFGGNDSDYDWKAISDNPEGIHEPKTSIPLFKETYSQMVDFFLEKDIEPILMTLPPVQSDLYFQWICERDSLNGNNVMKWLGKLENIGMGQADFSYAVLDVAKTKGLKTVDLRTAFKNSGEEKNLFCRDGIHPNTKGQKLIGKCVSSFMEGLMTEKIA
ncbi:MAG: SGNH/GDSL hydrolase family protein [Sphaerochaetaceae bacterium]|nr:SGNH/GDSL hydrolase family protein [Sphaerochaetaceae bacterium]